MQNRRSASNGRAGFHAEAPLRGDIKLAVEATLIEGTLFMDGHYINGSVPGDRAHILSPCLIGPVRAKYFLQMASGEVPRIRCRRGRQ